jgi:hypothetical protein
MRYLGKILLLTLLIMGITTAFPTMVTADTEIPKCKLPVITTSAGQSTDVNTLNIIMEEAGIKYDYCDVPSVKLLKSGVGLGEAKSGKGFHVEVYTDLEKFPKGSTYKTIIIAIGSSLKGMGASGLTIDQEEKRLKEIIDFCKANKIFIIAAHLGGISKRGAAGGDNERMIDAIAPRADYIIVVADSNKDGRFTDIAKKTGVPITEIKYALGLVDIIKKVFE